MAQHGKPVDMAGLVAEHGDALYRYAYRLTGSSADAEDLSQQVFLIAYQKLEQLRDAACTRSWLSVVLRHAFLRSRRKFQAIPSANLDMDMESVPDEIDATVEIDQEGLQAAINELPDDFKAVVLAFYFEEASYREIAEQFGVPLGTVMSRLSRAKAHLRRRLLDADLVEAAGKGRAVPRRSQK